MVMFSMTISAQVVKTHTVKRGETMETIAQMYDVSVDDIKRANSNAGDMFYAGMKLVIPAKSEKIQKPVSQPTPVPTNQQPKGTTEIKEIKEIKSETTSNQNNSSLNYLRCIDATYSFGFFSPSEGDSQSFSAITVGISAYQNFNKIPQLYGFTKFNAQYSFRSKKEGIVENSFKMVSINSTWGAAYAFEIPNSNVKIMPKAGINFRFNIYGLQKKETSYKGVTTIHKANVFDKKDMGSDEATWNWFNFGGLIGVDAVFSDRFIAGASYQMDFTNIAPKTNINLINISFGYCF